MVNIVFTFPGQGGYSYNVIRDLYLNFPDFKPLFLKADIITSEKLAARFLPLVEAENKQVHDAYLAEFPDLDQVGIYLTNILIAKLHLQNGIKPAILVGHSFGEISALAIANVFTEEAGIQIVCDRIKALQQSNHSGKMAALSCNADSAIQLIKDNGLDLHIVVQNYPKQTVVAGIVNDLENLQALATSKGISLTFIKSRYPFHSPFLKESVTPFYKSLKSYKFEQSKYPVYLCTEHRLYDERLDLPKILSSEFTTPFSFSKIIDNLVESGFQNFIECGSSEIISNIIRRNVTAIPGVNIRSTVKKDQMLLSGINELYQNIGIPSRIISNVTETKNYEYWDRENFNGEPVAIISMGSVLPGSVGIDHFWKNITEGVNGIVDLGEFKPSLREDIFAGTQSNPVPDKTYTLLSGFVPGVEWNERLLGKYYTHKAFEKLCKAEKMLAHATAECLELIAHKETPASGIKCFLGSTADGIAELGYATYFDALEKEMRAIDASVTGRQGTELSSMIKSEVYNAGEITQYSVCSRTINTILAKNIETVVLDTACSSSLYATYMAIKAIANRECDLALAGGVYAADPTTNALFAQFKGLTPTDSTPLDKHADGVVFADGAALVALKRLDDAIKDGNKIIAVIRSVGLSSDGKSSSINVPRTSGQKLAVKNAIANAGISIDTLQYFEAHATATPVGDAVEFNSLKEIAGTRDNNLPPIALGSIKALIGHTGWLSGTASLIKICKAFEENTIPKQYKYSGPGEGIRLEGSNLDISTEHKPWPINIYGLPKRAGVNSFGFGGTNAHIIIESYQPAYHEYLLKKTKARSTASVKLAVVSTGFLYPSDDSLSQELPSSVTKFNRNKFVLPAKKILLPDVTEAMDPGQFISSLAAEKILNTLAGKWEGLREKTSVVIGMNSRTERGLWASDRLIADQMKRLAQSNAKYAHSKTLSLAAENLKQKRPQSTPYTLPGLMPNITASRISYLFDLQGPNMVIDSGQNSLMQAIETAGRLLSFGDSELVISGGISCCIDEHFGEAEAACMIGLTTKEAAHKYGFSILCELEIKAGDYNHPANIPEFNYKGASQGPALQLAIQEASKTGGTVVIGKNTDNNFTLVSPVLKTADNKNKAPKKPGFVEGTRIYYYHPEWIKQDPETVSPVSLKDRKILFITDQPEYWKSLEASGMLEPFSYQVLTPGSFGLKNEIAIHEINEESFSAALQGCKVQNIIGVRTLKDHKINSLLTEKFEHGRNYSDLLFLVNKYFYHDIADKKIHSSVVNLGAWHKDKLHPFTGLTAGFMKSLARELSKQVCQIINTDETHLLKALHQLETELGISDTAEVAYKNNQRHVSCLSTLTTLAKETNAFINSDTVVLATGGGRGVTAVMAEALLVNYGCTVIATGRSGYAGVPQQFLEMDEIAFRSHEPDFYKNELAKYPGTKITELKNRFLKYQAANEVYQTEKRLSGLQGKYQYIQCDITDQLQVDELVKKIYEDYGQVNLVVHGAGVQKSGALNKRSLKDFRDVIFTKIGSLAYIYQSIEALNKTVMPVHYHLLTSAFSYLGNDGQPDYGAANEAMNRLSDSMTAEQPHTHWSALAWLGWTKTGMTKSSEYDMLASSRDLRGITRSEGAEIFLSLTSGTPSAAATILISDGEKKFYNPLLDDDTAGNIGFSSGEETQRSMTHEYVLSTDTMPILKEHVVSDIPTLPGAMMNVMIADTAVKLMKGYHVSGFKDSESMKFIRVPEGKNVTLRINAEVISDNGEYAEVRCRIFSDFIHRSGRVLQQDILHNESVVMLSAKPLSSSEKLHTTIDGPEITDYYLSNDLVALSGCFDSLSGIIAGEEERKSTFSLEKHMYQLSGFNIFNPAMLLIDSLWRFGTIDHKSQDWNNMYVPMKGGEIKLYFDFTGYQKHPQLLNKLFFHATHPIVNGDILELGNLTVTDDNNNVILTSKGGMAKYFGKAEKKEVRGYPLTHNVN